MPRQPAHGARSCLPGVVEEHPVIPSLQAKNVRVDHDMAEEPQFRLSPATVVLFVGFAGLLIAQVFTIRSLRSAESKLASLQANQSNVRDVIEGEVAKMRESSALVEAERQKALEAVRDEVDKARRQVRGVAGKVKEETMKSVDELASRVGASESKLKQQQEAGARVASEITGLRQATKSAQSNITDVSTEVKQVRTEVAKTQSQLERTIADLKRTTGDLGVMSGLIATNSREVDALKQLGDRNYTEFTLYKRKEPIKVADVSILLKKADVKASRYTLELQVDDRKIDKKDRSANEPVQFYVGHNRQPHELVVNHVGKDQIVGYLATPKAAASRP
jgi:predicted  nucleic acid-binding Zn-ribbon protein